MKQAWFKPWGWVYAPQTTAGWVITVLTLVLCVWVVLAVDRQAHSVSDTLIGAFPYVAIFLILGNWIASRTSR